MWLPINYIFALCVHVCVFVCYVSMCVFLCVYVCVCARARVSQINLDNYYLYFGENKSNDL